MPQEHMNEVDSRVQPLQQQQDVNGLDERDCLEDDLTERIKLKSESKRLETFKKWPKSVPVRPDELAREGFYYFGKDDQAKCIFCNLILKSWEKGDVVRDEHMKFNSNCSFLLGQNCGNVPIIRTPLPGTSSGASGNRVRYPEYSKPVTREETFRNVQINQNIDELVGAGFFYEGHDDYVKCFHCGISICHWDSNDDPYVEHLHWSPHCEFAQKHQPHRSESLTPVMRRALEMGYEEQSIRNAVQRNRRSGSEFKDLSVLVDELEKLKLEQNNVYGRQDSQPSTPLSSQPMSTVSSLESENRELKEKMLCKICMERDVSVTFLPCGHLVVCEPCGRRVKQCPMCRKHIRGYVKTFLS